MSQAVTRKRDLNMDIVRCLALFFVLGIHFYTHCDIFNAGYTGLAAFFADAARNLFMCSLSIFVMLNGYFQYRKTISSSYYLGILKLYEMYVLTSVLNLLYSRFYLGQVMSLREIFSALVNYGASEYAWYVLMYNGLFLLIPFLNLSYNNIAHRGHKRILIISFFLLSATPFSFLNAFVNLNSYWWQRIWPLMFYFIGAYFGEYRPRVSAKKCGLLFLALLMGFSAYNYFVYEPSSPFFGHAGASYRYTYESLQNALLSPVLFLWVMNVDMSAWPKAVGKLASMVSTRVYGAFLFSSITDSFVYLWLCRFVPEIGNRFIFFPLTLPVSYVAAVFLAYLGDKVVLWLDKLIRPAARALVSWLYRMTAPDAAAVEK